jgi:act minimal PKS acyl carrier protein
MTPDELIAIIRASAGEPEGGCLDGASVDIAFEELGYDSIQLLEIAAHIKRELDISLSDDIIAETRTMRELLGVIDAEAAGRPAR